MELADKIFSLLNRPLTYAEIHQKIYPNPKNLEVEKRQIQKAVRELQNRGTVYLEGDTTARRIMLLPDAIDVLKKSINELRLKIQEIEKTEK